MLHTYMNKITGFLLFLFPLVYKITGMNVISVIICFVATGAAIEEYIIIRNSDSVDSDIKTILKIRKKSA